MSDGPHVIVLAGPNGSGKSTSAPYLLRDEFAVTEFVNADVIAQGLSAFRPEGVAMEAGRLMLRRLDELATSRVSFAFETTLASRTFAPWLRKQMESGYHFHLLFLWLPSPEQNVARVASRVRAGGHHVPDETVRRRYRNGIQNFFHLYRPFCTSWRFYDNNARIPRQPRLIAQGAGATTERILDPLLWAQIAGEYEHGTGHDQIR